MIPPLSRLSSIALTGSLIIVWPFFGGCSHASTQPHCRAVRLPC